MAYSSSRTRICCGVHVVDFCEAHLCAVLCLACLISYSTSVGAFTDHSQSAKNIDRKLSPKSVTDPGTNFKAGTNFTEWAE